MVRSKTTLVIILTLSALAAIPCLPLPAGSREGQQRAAGEAAGGPGAGQTAAYPAMPAPGKKIQFEGGYYFIYGFDKKPQLGPVIIKVEIFSRSGEKETSLEVKADAGMPSMRGAHETGARSLLVSKKGVYLLPIDIVMPGDWEIRLTILKGGRVVFRGSHKFHV